MDERSRKNAEEQKKKKEEAKKEWRYLQDSTIKHISDKLRFWRNTDVTTTKDL